MSTAIASQNSLNIFGRRLVLEDDRATCGARFLSTQTLVGVDTTFKQSHTAATTATTAASYAAANYAAASNHTTSAIKLTSKTTATLPEPRTRTTIGVGEFVTITTNIPVNWRIDDEQLARITKQDSQTIEIQANDKAGKCSITATGKTSGKTGSITFTILEPQSIEYRLGRYEDYPNVHGLRKEKGMLIYHLKNGNEAYVGLCMKLLPTSVNFSNVLLHELNCASVNTGCFDTGKVMCHINTLPPVNNKCEGKGGDYDFHTLGNEHNICIGFDRVGGGDNDLDADIGQGGTMDLDIPLQWSIKTLNNWKDMGTVHQRITLDSNHIMVVSKGNFHHILNKNDNYPDNSFL